MIDSLGLILVGAGASRRMGQVDKVWAGLGGHPIVWHALTRLGPIAGECVLVLRADSVERGRRLCEMFAHVRVVAGGSERQESVRLGLQAIEHADAVAVHDVARPFAGESLLRAGRDCLQDFDGAVPVVPVVDTIKVVDGARIVRTLDRSTLRAVQTPQVFRADALREAHVRAQAGGVSGTDDAQLLEMFGFRVGAFPGDPNNFKITTEDDLSRARSLVEGAGRP